LLRGPRQTFVAVVTVFTMPRNAVQEATQHPTLSRSEESPL